MSNDHNESPKQPDDVLSPENESIPMPPELQEIIRKMEAGEELSFEQQNVVLSMELVQTRKELQMTKAVMTNMVKHLCAVVGIFHNGLLRIDKTQWDRFFAQFDARASVGIEQITGNPVVQVQVRPRKDKKLLEASPQEQAQVTKSRIIIP